jgi:hypothetical protein
MLGMVEQQSHVDIIAIGWELEAMPELKKKNSCTLLLA